MSIQPFTTAVDCSRIGCLMEVSTMYYILQILRFYLGRPNCRDAAKNYFAKMWRT